MLATSVIRSSVPETSLSSRVKILDQGFPLATEVVAKKVAAEQQLEQVLSILHDAQALSKAKGAEKELASLYAKVAAYYLLVKSAPETSFKYAQLALNIRKTIHGNTLHEDLLKSNNLLGLISNTQKELQQALAYYQAAIQIGKALGEDSYLELAKAYRNAGSIYYNMDQEIEAIGYHLEAYKIRQKLYPKGHVDLITTSREIAISYDALMKKAGKSAKAAEYAQAALDHYQKAYTMATALGDTDKAAELQESISELEPLVEQHNKSAFDRRASTASTDSDRSSGTDSPPRKDSPRSENKDQKAELKEKKGNELGGLSAGVKSLSISAKSDNYDSALEMYKKGMVQYKLGKPVSGKPFFNEVINLYSNGQMNEAYAPMFERMAEAAKSADQSMALRCRQFQLEVFSAFPQKFKQERQEANQAIAALQSALSTPAVSVVAVGPMVQRGGSVPMSSVHMGAGYMPSQMAPLVGYAPGVTITQQGMGMQRVNTNGQAVTQRG